MRRSFLLAYLIAGAALFCSCNKENIVMNETTFHGTWVKGANTGDTLRFFQRNGQNLMTYNLSFNTAVYAPAEVEYIYRNGKPGFKNYLASQGDVFIIESFEWIWPGREFKLQGSELFSFMSSTLVHFTYRKIP